MSFILTDFYTGTVSQGLINVTIGAVIGLRFPLSTPVSLSLHSHFQDLQHLAKYQKPIEASKNVSVFGVATTSTQ